MILINMMICDQQGGTGAPIKCFKRDPRQDHERCQRRKTDGTGWERNPECCGPADISMVNGTVTGVRCEHPGLFYLEMSTVQCGEA
jgi:hypothetical protein